MTRSLLVLKHSGGTFVRLKLRFRFEVGGCRISQAHWYLQGLCSSGTNVGPKGGAFNGNRNSNFPLLQLRKDAHAGSASAAWHFAAFKRETECLSQLREESRAQGIELQSGPVSSRHLNGFILGVRWRHKQTA